MSLSLSLTLNSPEELRPWAIALGGTQQPDVPKASSAGITPVAVATALGAPAMASDPAECFDMIRACVSDSQVLDALCRLAGFEPDAYLALTPDQATAEAEAILQSIREAHRLSQPEPSPAIAHEGLPEALEAAGWWNPGCPPAVVVERISQAIAKAKADAEEGLADRQRHAELFAQSQVLAELQAELRDLQLLGPMGSLTELRVNLSRVLAQAEAYGEAKAGRAAAATQAPSPPAEASPVAPAEHLTGVVVELVREGLAPEPKATPSKRDEKQWRNAFSWLAPGDIKASGSTRSYLHDVEAGIWVPGAGWASGFTASPPAGQRLAVSYRPDPSGAIKEVRGLFLARTPDALRLADRTIPTDMLVGWRPLLGRPGHPEASPQDEAPAEVVAPVEEVAPKPEPASEAPNAPTEAPPRPWFQQLAIEASSPLARAIAHLEETEGPVEPRLAAQLAKVELDPVGARFTRAQVAWARQKAGRCGPLWSHVSHGPECLELLEPGDHVWVCLRHASGFVAADARQYVVEGTMGSVGTIPVQEVSSLHPSTYLVAAHVASFRHLAGSPAEQRCSCHQAQAPATYPEWEVPSIGSKVTVGRWDPPGHEEHEGGGAQVWGGSVTQLGDDGLFHVEATTGQLIAVHPALGFSWMYGADRGRDLATYPGPGYGNGWWANQHRADQGAPLAPEAPSAPTEPSPEASSPAPAPTAPSPEASTPAPAPEPEMIPLGDRQPAVGTWVHATRGLLSMRGKVDSASPTSLTVDRRTWQPPGLVIEWRPMTEDEVAWAYEVRGLTPAKPTAPSAPVAPAVPQGDRPAEGSTVTACSLGHAELGPQFWTLPVGMHTPDGFTLQRPHGAGAVFVTPGPGRAWGWAPGAGGEAEAKALEMAERNLTAYQVPDSSIPF